MTFACRPFRQVSLWMVSVCIVDIVHVEITFDQSTGELRIIKV
jgi:hypothetical protein